MKTWLFKARRSAAIFALAFLLPQSAFAEKIGRLPYLQSTTSDSTTIVWTTDVEAPSEVQIGSTPGEAKQTIHDDTPVKHHEVKITGLSPNTRYYYSVGSPGKKLAGGDSGHYFQTNPEPGTIKKFRAWILGDSGDGSLRQAAVRDSMLAYTSTHPPEIFLHLGDIAYYSGTPDEFTSRFFYAYPQILRNTTCWPTMGNHEGVTSDSGLQTGPYYTAYVLPKGGEAGGLPSGTEAYYSFDYANVHFIVLDSHDSPRDPAGAMLTWLKADLSSTNQEWIVAYWHHPPYSKGNHDSDLEWQLVEMRQNALPILEAGGVDLVMSGHSHLYERSYLIDGAYGTPTTANGHIVNGGDGRPLGTGPYKKSVGNVAHEGAVYVVAGHGGAFPSGLGGHPVMYYDETDNGSCLLDVQGNRLSLVNLRWDGNVTDRFALVKGTGLVLASPDGRETLEKSSSFDIRWATVGNISDVKLEYSIDDGQNFTTIEASVPNTGKYTWVVPAVDSKRAIVRISDASNADTFDESNAGFSLIGGDPEQAITFGDVWSYSDEGVDHGISWLAVNFKDAGWKVGKGQFGYGEGDESTVLLDVAPNYPSTYFRKKITLDREVTKAELTVLHDDGVIVWINGRQVYSKYVGDPWYGALAVGQSKDNEIDKTTISLADYPFVIGENVVAVMVKQVSDGSSDLSFDLSLTLRKSVNAGSSSTGETSSVSNGSSGNGGAGTGGAGEGGMNTGGKPAMDKSGTCACSTVGESRGGAMSFGLIFAAYLRRRKKAVN
jgi:Calcineurin-like phosphoesterase/Purple acid Phosphatase, N-terminal domain